MYANGVSFRGPCGSQRLCQVCETGDNSFLMKNIIIIITTITNIQDDQFTNVRDNNIIIIIHAAQTLLKNQFVISDFQSIYHFSNQPQLHLYPSKSAQELLSTPERRFYPQVFGLNP